MKEEGMWPVGRRRVVTGFDANGASIIVSDGPSPGRMEYPDRQWEELWAFDAIPASLSDPADPAAVESFRLTPVEGRIACRIFTTRPQDWPRDEEQEQAWRSRFDYGETETIPDEPGMHRTPTIDIIVVISGEMDLVLDGGETVHLVPGDSVIQRGTMHNWRNTGTEPCVAVAFMARAE